MAPGTFKGYLAQLSYGEEVTYGTAVSATTEFGRVTSFAPAPANEFYKGRGIGEGRNIQDATIGKFNLTGTVTFEVKEGGILKQALGAESGSNPYTVTEANNIPSITIEAGYEAGDGTLIIDKYKGCVCQSLELNATQGAKLVATYNFLGQDGISDGVSKATVTRPTDNPFVFEQGTIKRNSVAIARVDSFVITIANTIDPDFAIGDRFIKEPQTGPRDYTFTLNAKLLDKTFMDDFYGDTDEPMDGVTSTSPTSITLDLDFTQDGSRYLRVTLTDCYLEGFTKGIDAPEAYIMQGLSGFAKSGGAAYGTS